MDEPNKKHGSKNHAHGKPEEGGNEKPEGEQQKQPVIAMSIEEYDAMKAELEKALKDAAANMDGWQRERAEFSNYKRRIDRDQAILAQTVTGDVIKKYLVILDDLELALKNRPHGGHGAAWSEGIELIVRKLQAIIEGEGIEIINQNKVPFDPNLHEAISNEDCTGFECGHVIEVVRQGYKLGDRILRPAMVRVAR
jgi:molecular chaperone GrpE